MNSFLTLPWETEIKSVGVVMTVWKRPELTSGEMIYLNTNPTTELYGF